MGYAQTNIATAVGFGGPDTQYNARAGIMPGADGATSFVAAALFIVRQWGGDQYIFANRDVGTFGGWAIGVTGDPDTGVIFAEMGDGVGAFDREVGSFSAPLTSGRLVLVHLVLNAPNTFEIHMNGGVAFSGVATSPTVSALAAALGSDTGGGSPCPGVQILGAAYLNTGGGGWSQGASSINFAACCRAGRMAQTSEVFPTLPGAPWDYRWDAREGLNPGAVIDPAVLPAGSGALAPAVWSPSDGVEVLTRENANAITAVTGQTNVPWAP